MNSPISNRELLEEYATRKAKILRIREIERELEKMETDDEGNDPVLIRGNIRMIQGANAGCGVAMLCVAILSVRVVLDGHGWAGALAGVCLIGGVVMILRGLLYRPDVKEVHESYVPHRTTARYRELVDHLEVLARALSQDLQAEDEE